MAISERLQAHLKQAKARYTVAKHPTAYTAQELAAAQHVPGRRMAKCVLVTTDGGPLLAVLPATQLIDFKLLKRVVRAKTLRIATEADIKRHFPDVEVGAMSPFGNLYGVPVAVERTLGESEAITFNAGSHTETMTMRYQDVVDLVKPRVGAFAHPIISPPPKRKGKASASRSRAAASNTKQQRQKPRRRTGPTRRASTRRRGRSDTGAKKNGRKR